ncbi:MAG: hypothetical protein JRN26_07295 [Nitrososphaerota archaeon]|jgi:hypothetical protein|nr:hypothetical protein [Nitrososphaerota archaeon]MDG6932112.1 hypothetical protein [Nitrososphaerota archaeon]MDG6936667.1 hypothetical protein [Nitrososphaerota archaeon]MDG6944273.1 hypothetical protein [Nitrososphaerota archaeon]
MSTEETGELELHAGNPKTWSLVALIVGILDLITIPIAMTMSYSYNYLVVEINSVVAIIVIILASIDYIQKGKGGKGIAIPVVLLILGFVIFFMFPQAYSTPYIMQYHLYIINTETSNQVLHVSNYNARDALWGLSFGWGFILWLIMALDIYAIKKQPAK